ncbi:MAG: sodium:calcium antiporter [Chloroflexi bacterium]|nr:sodium:calcium antiporter [Chloroflexota bacterium]
MVWIEFIICVIVVIAASNILSRYADVIAEKTGLGRAWVGAILLAGVTSLPELVSGITAVTLLNAPNLAIGGIVGSNLFNLTLIAVMDVAYQPGSILAQAEEGHMLSAGLGILLMGLIVASPLLGVSLSGVGILGVSFISIGIFVLYLIGTRLLGIFQRKRALEFLEQEAEALHYDQISRRRTYLMFLGAGLIVVAAGVWLGSIADRIAVETGLGRSFVGALFLGVSTSLPEIATSLSAVRMGAIDLAIGNVLGSNLFNVMLLSVYDVFDGPQNLWASLSTANALASVMAIMMTAVVVISLIYRASSRTPFRINWDGAALLAMYAGALVLLYVMQ